MTAREGGVRGEGPTSPLSSAPTSRASSVVYEDDDDDPLAAWDPHAGSPRGSATTGLTALSGTGTHRRHTVGSRRGRWQWLRGKRASGDYGKGDGDNIDEDDDDVAGDEELDELEPD